MPDLLAATDRLKLFADPTRVRLLHLVAGEELTVAEITRVTGLVQSRVSTHLGKLREAGLLRVRRDGAATYYSLDESGMPEEARQLWRLLAETRVDAVVAEDRRRARAVLAARGGSWADSVAGRMERHYAPGRTWEAAARALVGLATLGDVLDVASGDGALAELISPRARSVTCLDVSAKVVDAGRARLGHLPTVRLQQGDMHSLPFADASFDHVLLVNALSYAADPAAAVAEAARVARDHAELVVTALVEHAHAEVAARYDHVQMGFSPEVVAGLARASGFHVESCAITSRERREPHFEVITLHGRRRPRGGDGPAVARPRRGGRIP